MRFLSAFSLLLSVASAAKVSLSFILDAEEDMSSLVIYRRNGGVLMGRCGRTINSTVPIDFSQVTVNGEGAIPPYGNYDEESTSIIPITSGNFTVGKATYAIHPNPVFSGGPSCKTDVDPVNNRISIYCKRLYWDHTDIMPENKTVDTDCFGPYPPVKGERDPDYYPGNGKRPFYKRNSMLEPDYSPGNETQPFYKRDLMLKMGRRCPKKKEKPVITSLDGAGWPHQRYLFEQISEVVHCGHNQTCCASSDTSKAIAYGVSMMASVGINVGVKAPQDTVGVNLDFSVTWGLSVTKTWTIGNSYTCHGKEGDTVCVWYKVAHTAITVRNQRPARRHDKLRGIKTQPYGKQMVVAAPNRRNEGGGVVCKYNDECKSLGDTYWDCYGTEDPHFRYCPPLGYPPKLDPADGPLPQDSESMAIKRDREEKKKKMIAAKG
ncbi:uncharacterized protein FSUBG_13650 [Fusarium subglutinans]|uniref:Uncharacterized protein n=1 Tax=Gibberella subglutinans TaxID=42677 RepID=A0A8H5KWI1_GIBSU|nr:uncharacterized protein FSUBG_13650 [Fusarium subglutinans]KAF5579275.1 hypothetical protein FSUBG_13650 [Fusarium subglutinans]